MPGSKNSHEDDDQSSLSASSSSSSLTSVYYDANEDLVTGTSSSASLSTNNDDHQDAHIDGSIDEKLTHKEESTDPDDASTSEDDLDDSDDESSLNTTASDSSLHKDDADDYPVKKLSRRELEIQRAIAALKEKIKDMSNYGQQLCLINKPSDPFGIDDSDDSKKGNQAIELARILLDQVEAFEEEPRADKYTAFSTEFKRTLGEKKSELQAHRAQWKPILANIFIALTGLGALLILGKVLVAAASKEGLSFNSGFFGARTNREKNAIKVEHAIDALDNSVYRPTR